MEPKLRQMGFGPDERNASRSEGGVQSGGEGESQGQEDRKRSHNEKTAHPRKVLAQTLDQVAPQLGPTFDGLSRVSTALNNRNESLAELLKAAGEVTGVFSERSRQVNTLILNANDLVAVLNERRYAITSLLSSISAVSQQLTGVVADNEQELAPALERLNNVTRMLERNRDNLSKMLPGAAKYYLTQGEIVSNGAYYNALVPNVQPAQLLQPFLDYAFGFRRGVEAGQPPDNAGPRAELPFPVNGIPQPGDLPNDGNP